MEGLLHSLAGYNPKSVRYYRWNYSWLDIKAMFIQKQREVADHTNAFCEFLVELVSAAVGGGKDPEVIGLDTGEGKEEMSEEQVEMWRGILTPAEFAAQYPDYI